MKLRFLDGLVLWAILLSSMSGSCTSPATKRILLVSFRENYVDISIYLEGTSEGKYLLSATFTPPEGYHLYSKDIPITGINGLGRPTLLELTAASAVRVTGSLTESAPAQVSDSEPKELLVYPLGPVTLSLPVELPPGNDWTEDEIQVTYMACRASQCKPPVVAKRVRIPIPGADVLDHQWRSK